MESVPKPAVYLQELTLLSAREDSIAKIFSKRYQYIIKDL